MGHIGAQEILILSLIFIVLFGARKLPETAKGIAQSLRVFKNELRDEEKPTAESAQATGQGEVSESTPSTSADTSISSDTAAASTSESATRSVSS